MPETLPYIVRFRPWWGDVVLKEAHTHNGVNCSRVEWTVLGLKQLSYVLMKAAVEVDVNANIANIVT